MDTSRADHAPAVPDDTDALATLRDVAVEFTTSREDGTATRALAGISLDVFRGELLVLVGRSGCGKTTALNVLAGLQDPSRGSAQVLGRSPVEARSHIAYMFARDALLPWRTAVRNVEFALELRRPGLGRAQRKQRARTLLESLGVGGSANLFPWQLSQGMRQRVALARTWAVEPDLLLMDEPFAALDAQTRSDTQQLFLELWARYRRTVVFVTHDLSEALLLADRVIVLRDGMIVDDVSVDIPRPRDGDALVLDETYRRTHKRVADALHGSSGPSASAVAPVLA